MRGRLAALRDDARACTACELYRNATQTVFGDGLSSSPLMLVGEQPGDQEDRVGEPFVGPAGKLLVRARRDAGLADTPTYVTNAVKHFRWEPRGKRRIHKTPGVEHIRACRGWLSDELAIVDPEVLVLLGAVAAKALAPELRVMRDRGQPHELDGRTTIVTVHPSSVLRSEQRSEAYDAFVADLVVARECLRSVSASGASTAGGRTSR